MKVTNIAESEHEKKVKEKSSRIARFTVERMPNDCCVVNLMRFFCVAVSLSCSSLSFVACRSCLLAKMCCVRVHAIFSFTVCTLTIVFLFAFFSAFRFVLYHFILWFVVGFLVFVFMESHFHTFYYMIFINYRSVEKVDTFRVSLPTTTSPKSKMKRTNERNEIQIHFSFSQPKLTRDTPN